MKEFDSVVAELVEKRMNDYIRDAVRDSEEDDYGHSQQGELRRAIDNKLREVVKDEVDKKEDEIRKVVAEKISKAVENFKPSFSIAFGRDRY